MNTAAVRVIARAGVERICRHCRHCEHDRAVLEATIPGLASFGSAFGASVGESRLCRVQDRLVAPRDTCEHFSGDDMDASAGELAARDHPGSQTPPA